MITKEQIEQEAISRYGKYAKSIQQDSVIKLIMNAFNYGAEWAIKQQPYSAEDMIAFGKWLWIEIECWERESDEINYYVKKWEEQK